MDEPILDWSTPRATGVFFPAPRSLDVVRAGARLATFSCISDDAEVMVSFEKIAESCDAFPGIGVCETINLRDWNLARTMFALGVLTERGMIAPEAS